MVASTVRVTTTASPVVRTGRTGRRFPRKVARVIQAASMAVSHDSAQQKSRRIQGSITWLKAIYGLICAIGYSPDESAIDDALCIPPTSLSLSPPFFTGKYFWKAGANPRLVGGTAWTVSPSEGALMQAAARRCGPSSRRGASAAQVSPPLAAHAGAGAGGGSRWGCY